MATSYLQRLRLIRREAWLAMTAMMTFGLVPRGVFAVVLNLYLLRMQYGPEFIGLVNALWLLTYARLALPAGLLARRRGNQRMVILGKTLEATSFTLVALVLLLLVPHWVTAWLAMAMAFVSVLVGSAIGLVYAQELVAPEWRATISGSIGLALGLGTGIVSLLGGRVIAAWGYPALFALSAAFGLSSGALFWACFRTPRGELRAAAAGAGGK